MSNYKNKWKVVNPDNSANVSKEIVETKSILSATVDDLQQLRNNISTLLGDGTNAARFDRLEEKIDFVHSEIQNLITAMEAHACHCDEAPPAVDFTASNTDIVFNIDTPVISVLLGGVNTPDQYEIAGNTSGLSVEKLGNSIRLSVDNGYLHQMLADQHGVFKVKRISDETEISVKYKISCFEAYPEEPGILGENLVFSQENPSTTLELGAFPRNLLNIAGRTNNPFGGATGAFMGEKLSSGGVWDMPYFRLRLAYNAAFRIEQGGFILGETYSVSFFARKRGPLTSAYLTAHPTEMSFYNQLKDDRWSRILLENIKLISWTSFNLNFGGLNGEIDLCCMKIEKGAKCTPYVDYFAGTSLYDLSGIPNQFDREEIDGKVKITVRDEFIPLSEDTEGSFIIKDNRSGSYDLFDFIIKCTERQPEPEDFEATPSHLPFTTDDLIWQVNLRNVDPNSGYDIEGDMTPFDIFSEDDYIVFELNTEYHLALDEDENSSFDIVRRSDGQRKTITYTIPAI